MSFRGIPVHVSLPAVGGTVWVKAPSVDAGGAVSIVDIRALNGAATSSTNSFTCDVLVGTGSGTPTISGTVASIGGTASHWAVGVAQGATPSGTASKVAGDGWIGVRTVQQGTGTVTQPAHVTVTIVSGVTGG